MSTLFFHDIPNKYKVKIEQMKQDDLKNIYSNFTFLYFPLIKSDLNETNTEQKQIESFLFNFLNGFKLITYKFINPNEQFQLAISKIENDCNLSSQFVKAVICVEMKCLIIELIDLDLITKILQKTKSKLINSVSNDNNITDEEIGNFYSHFAKYIKNNDFFQLTIHPILAFIIQRHFCPTSYFKNASFFKYKQSINGEEMRKAKFTYILFSKNLNEFNVNNQKNNSNIFVRDNDQKSIQFFEFGIKDFVRLRKIYSNSNYAFYLAIHIESLNIFMMKTMNDWKNTSLHRHEIQFCTKFSHRCFARFYGFLKNKQTITGFIYEYLCNGPIMEHKSELTEIYSFQVMNRLFQGIEYLHSNCLIHRDLKPSNILLDHDFVPYISDFETIRLTNEDDENEVKTNDIGSILYTSPEQSCGTKYGLKSDIYSFGLIVYYLFERKDWVETSDPFLIQDMKKREEFKKMTNCSKNIQILFSKCTKYNQSERCSLNEIKSILYVESKSFVYLENYLKSEIKISQLIQYIYENFLIQIEKVGDLNDAFNYVFICFLLIRYYFRINPRINENQLIHSNYFDFSSKQNESSVLFCLGLLYEKRKEYVKSRKFYDLAAQMDNSNALVNLGYVYTEGLGVEQNYVKAIEYYKLAAKLGNSEAIWSLGNFNLDGNGVEQSYVKAKEYFDFAAQQSNSNAFCSLGKLYMNGYGIKKNFSEAKKYFELASQSENDEALFLLGTMHENGLGVAQNYLKAKEYYELSSHHGNSNALNNLGNLYKNGLGVEQNFLKAIEYFKQSSQYHNSFALYNLGIIYQNGFGVGKNSLKAIDYFESSSKLNNSKASLKLGIIYLNGLGVPKNYLKAKEYFKLASNKNNSEALFFLGFMYENGLGFEQNYLKAKNFFEFSAQMGNSDALNSLGIIYQNGFGVEKNYLTAKKKFELSASLGNSNALNNLGVLYLDGNNEKNISKAKDYFERAAKQQNSSAFVNLGRLYLGYYEIPKDYFRAKMYFELAAQQNDPCGLYCLGNLYIEGCGVEKSITKAIKYYELSAEQENAEAFLALGHIYKEGIGIDQNYLKAKEYFEKAAKKNSADALFQLGLIYFNGLGLNNNYLKGKDYFELAANQNNPQSLFCLGYIFENGIYFDVDISKAIDYLSKSCDFHYESIQFHIQKESLYLSCTKCSDFYYRSNNDLGLIYFTIYHDIQKATKYIQEAAFGEYPFGQNNFGLLNQFYFDHIGNAKYMYKKSSKKQFVLSEFNLAKLYEKERNTTKMIRYYTRTSDHADIPLTFHNLIMIDEKLDISISFIICLTNLILSHFYLFHSDLKKSKFFFIKAFAKLINPSQKIQITVEKNDLKATLLYIKYFILNFPSFNIWNQPNLCIQSLNLIVKADNEYLESKGNLLTITSENENNLYQDDSINDKDEISATLNEKQKMKDLIKQKKYYFNEIEHKNELQEKKNKKLKKKVIFYNLSELFDFAVQDNEKTLIFINSIKEIIDIMEMILYNPPYSILFGRMNINRPKKKLKEDTASDLNNKVLNNLFYEGFGNDIS